MDVGENIKGHIVYVGGEYAVDVVTGEVWQGNPLLGLSLNGQKVHVPPQPQDDASDEKWNLWGKLIMSRIEEDE